MKKLIMFKLLDWLAMICLFIIIVMLLNGCTEDGNLITSDYATTSNNVADRLPVGAKNIIPVGNGWFTFEIYNGSAAGCYLIKQSFAGYTGYGYITMIACG